MKKRYVDILINSGLLFIGLIFSLALAEAFLRLSPKYRVKYDICQYAIKNNPMNIAMNRERDYCIYRPSSILGYELIPNSMPEVNSFGMIGKEVKLDKEKDTYRILVLGDSITEHNWYVKELEDRLNYSDPKLNYRFELWNGAVMGYQVNQYAAYLKYKGLKYRPDMVIIGFCLNDFETLYWVFYKDEKGFAIFYNPVRRLSQLYPLNDFLFRHSYLYRFLILKIENLLLTAADKSPKYENEGLHYLRIIRNICHENKIPLLAVIFPYLKSMSEYSESESWRYKTMVKDLNLLNIDYIDLHNYFPEKNRYALRMRSGDYIHPSAQGHEIAANAIYDYLLENYFGRSRSIKLTGIKNSGGTELLR